MTKSELVSVVEPESKESWKPSIGDTCEGLGEWLVGHKKLASIDAFESIRSSALEILSGCHPFHRDDGVRTGLVVGYVQSGKTMSMTTVSALARDNGCRIVILFAGVTKNLLDQSAERLTEQLRGASGNSTLWRIAASNNIRLAQEGPRFANALADWRDKSLEPQYQQTFLYLVLKNRAHLEKIHNLLMSADLRGIPALVFDDEADQASLNTSPDNPDPSTTYKWIGKIRDALPHHTYLQYTATPQAPLLIKLDDMLSPDFAEVVDPGAGYTGGLTFFGSGVAPHVRTLPSDELFRAGEPPDIAPATLLKALREFFVGCAVARKRGKPSPRSMLVHPSHLRADQAQYLSWVTKAAKQWAKMMLRGGQARDDLLTDMKAAYDDLATTSAQLPVFEDLQTQLRLALGRVNVQQVNSDGTEVNWDDAQEHILVGGEKLNRGFTLEGLTVTYMPRGPGGNNADTIQQRARFFGYKEGYLDLCRIYLHPDVRAAYREYVTHEEDVRKQLKEHQGKPLSEWRRAFFLSSSLKPARRNVISTYFDRRSQQKSWYIAAQPHVGVPIARNRENVAKFCEGKLADPQESAGYYQHWASRVPLQAVQDLLVGYAAGPADTIDFTAVRFWLSDILDRDTEAEALLLQMRKSKSERDRERSGKASFKLFQGASSKYEPEAYPGDMRLHDSQLVTLQVHWLRVEDIDGSVPALAVHIPRDLMRDDVLVQHA